MSPQQNGIDPRPAERQILLIEENLARRQVLYDALSGRGWQVYAAYSGDMALMILGYARPDLVLMNAALPDMTGSQLIVKTRSFNPGVPILLLGEESLQALSPETRQMVQASLPAAIAEERLLDEVNRWLSTPPAPLHPKPMGTILVIDDERRMRVILQNLLELNGFAVITAESGEEGLAQLPQAHPQAVMLDVRMPGMDGLLVLKKIRESYPSLPVILLTNVDETSAREEAMRLGATAYVNKPFNFDHLKQILRQAIPNGHPAAP